MMSSRQYASLDQKANEESLANEQDKAIIFASRCVCNKPKINRALGSGHQFCNHCHKWYIEGSTK
jgi:hypothetical protein